jgi:uncharacterized protein (TIGR03118 family)
MYGLRMTTIAQRIFSPRRRSACAKARRTSPRIEALEARLVLSGSGNSVYLQSNLVSDIPGAAQAFDPNLKDPWGLSFSKGSPFWVSDQASSVSGSSVTTLYSVNGQTGAPSVVPASFGIPNLGGAPPDTAINGPTGQVNTSAPGITTSATDFPLDGKKASFIFANMDGSISAWNGGPNATIIPSGSMPGASFTGLTIANDQTGAAFLYAADQNSGNVLVFNSQWALTGRLTDPQGLPAGFNAFNVQDINGLLYVTYTNQSIPSGGIVDVFKPDGTFDGRLINDPTGKWLDNPWGLTIAPQNFGKFGGDLLVGNNGGNHWINAFNPTTGAFKGVLTLASGQPFSENNLWALSFGNGVSGGVANTLYFTAGPGGTDGLFGSLQAIPSISAKAPIVPNLPEAAFQTVTTIPANGDVNPYGVAFVPAGFPTGGTISPGDVLVANFNSSSNLQGTGSTIVDISPNGSQSLFFQDPSAPGLDTALGVLKSGFVIVGNLPATYDSKGNLLSIGQGSLLILDRNGNVVTSLSDSSLLDGPWDLTINDQGNKAQVFVSNVLNGVVTRIDLNIPKGGNPIVESLTRIASGYLTRTDPAALVVGPTGLAYDPNRNVLYVASTGDNEVFAISNAGSRTSDQGMGRLVYQDESHLRGPLGLVLAPNGDLITANGDAVNPDPNQTSELVEFTTGGRFVGELSIDPNPGAAFGLAVTNAGGILRLAAVEDGTNSLDVWTFNASSRDRFASPGNWAGATPSAANFATTTGLPSGSHTGTSPASIVSRASSRKHSSMDSPRLKSSAAARKVRRPSAAIDQLFSVNHEADVATSLFPRRVRRSRS